ncbi:LOW QUALITY PROTEIN: hypothetical protein Bca4012_102655 [Brassica carinata]
MRSPPPSFAGLYDSFRISPNPARKVSRNIQLNSLLSPTREAVFVRSSAAILKRLATDISARIDEERAKCDTWCELQNPVNHRDFERKLRPKPSRRGHVCQGVTKRRPQSSRGYRTEEAGLPCYRTPLAKIRAKDARSVLTCGGEFTSPNRRSFGPKALDDPKSSTTPGDHPLSLSISISGGKETNKDSLSNGERTGRAQLENRTPSRSNCSPEKRLSDGPGPSSLERGAREGESPCVRTLSHHAGAVYESGCLGMQPQSGGKFRPRLNMGERPIANKYREVKMKRTLKRESKSA